MNQLKLVAVAVAVMAISGCQKPEAENVVQENVAQVEVSEENALGSWSLEKKEVALTWHPDGSDIQRNGNSIVVSVPDGWGYVGYGDDGSLIHYKQAGGKSISCTCTKEGDCDPFTASGPKGSVSGCMGDCTSCLMEQRSSESSSSQILAGGYYNGNIPTRLLRNGEQAPAVFDALLELEAFQQELSSFYRNAYGDRPVMDPQVGEDGLPGAPEGHSLVGLFIFGRGTIVVVPDDYAMRQLGYTTNVKASCDCTNGTCKLKKGDVLIGSAAWCTGDCSGTCTLTTSAALYDDHSAYAIALLSYKF